MHECTSLTSCISGSLPAFVALQLHVLYGLLTCPRTFWQGDNKGEAEAEDEERGKKENDGEEREEDGDKEAGKEDLGPPIA